MRFSPVIRWVLRVLLVVAALLLAGWIVLQSPWGKARVRDLAVRQASAFFDGELTVDRLDGSLWSSTTLHGVRVRQGGVVVLSADRVTVDYRLRVLASGAISLARIDADGVDVTVEERADGWTVRGLADDDTPARPDDPGPTISLPEIHVTRSRVAIVPAAAAARQLDEVSMRGSVMIVDGDITVVSTGLQAIERTGGMVVRQLTGTLELADSRIAVTDLALETAGSRLAGRVEMDGEPTVTQAHLTSDGLSLPEFAPYLAVLKDRALRPSFDLTFHGPLAALKVTGTVKSEAGGVEADVVAGLVDVVTVTGSARVVRLNLAPILRDPAQASVFTGDASFDFRIDDDVALGATGSFDARLSAVDFHDYAASGARARGRLTARGFVADVAGTAYGATTEAAVEWTSATRTFVADGRVRHLDMRQLPARLELARMETDGNGTYHVVVNDMGWNATATLDQSTAEGATLVEGTFIDLQSRGDQLTYTANGRVTNLVGQRHAPFLPSPSKWLLETPSVLDGTFTVSGSGGPKIPSHVLSFTYSDMHAVIDGAAMDAASGSGTLTHSRLVMSIDADMSRDWSRLLLFPGFEIQPTGHMVADVIVYDVMEELALEVVSGAGRVTFGPSDMFGFDVTEGAVDASWTGGTFTITAARMEANGLVATATGDFAAAGSGASNLAFVIDAADLGTLSALAGADLAGVGHAEGTITGSVTEPVITGTASATQLAYDAIRALGVTGTYALTAPEWDMTRLRGDVKADAVFVDVAGQTVQRAGITAALDGVQADVAAVLEQPDRRVNVNALLIVDADDREVLLQRADLAGGGETWTLAPGVTARFRQAAGRVTVDDLRLVNGDQLLTITGTLPMEPGGAAGDAVVVRAERVAVGGLSKIALGEDRVTGRLDGEARITGSVADPRIVSQFAVVDGTADGVNFTSFGGSANYQPGGATVDVRLDAGEAGTMSAVGTIPAGTPVAGVPALPLNLQLTGKLSNAAVLGPALPWLDDLKGTANFDVAVTGSLEKPLAKGTAVLIDVAFGAPELGTKYKGMNASLRFDDTLMTVEKFVVLDDDGHPLQVDGSLDVLAGGPSKALNLRARATEFHLMDNDYGEVVISADLTAGGDLVAPNVLGVIRVERGRIEVDRLLEEYVLAQGYVPVGGFATRPAAVGPVEPVVPPVPAMFSQSAISIELELPDNVVIRGRGIQTEEGIIGLGDINLTVGGLLRVTKSPGAPVSLLGEVAAVRGTYDFQGRRFAINRGSLLRFRGDDMTNPALDITAEREISGVEVTVRIRGTAAEPQLSLSSRPSLDEGDILALVAFGRPISQLGDAQRVSLAARAGTIAAGALATPLADSVARALDLDVFEIQAGDGVTSSTAVVVGRQVSDRLFVGFRHEFGGEGGQRLTFEYQLTEFLRLVSTIAPGGQSVSPTARTEAAGIDLIFVIRR
jgi:autotransporter translocation and assembly factor TamB